MIAMQAIALSLCPFLNPTMVWDELIAWTQRHSETLLALLVSIPIGFYLSLYVALIVARWARFEDLRYKLIRILQSLEWPPGSERFQLSGGHRASEITLISSDLISLGHGKAAKVAMKIHNEVFDELDRKKDFLTNEQKENRFTQWLRRARTMRPNSRVILDPRPRLYRKV